MPEDIKRQDAMNHAARVPSFRVARIEGRQFPIEAFQQFARSRACELWMSNPIAEKLQPKILGGVSVVFQDLSDLNQDVNDAVFSFRLLIENRPQLVGDGVSGHVVS